MKRFLIALSCHKIFNNSMLWIKPRAQIGFILISKADHLSDAFAIVVDWSLINGNEIFQLFGVIPIPLIRWSI